MLVLRSTGMCRPPMSSVSCFQLLPLSMRMASVPAASASSTSAPMVTDLPAPVSAATMACEAFERDESNAEKRKNSPVGVSRRLAVWPPHQGAKTGRKSPAFREVQPFLRSW
jgi:hypothetical protein